MAEKVKDEKKKPVVDSALGKNKNALGILSLILGIISIVFFWHLEGATGLIAGVLGVIFAILQKKAYPNNIAKAGFITSMIGIVLFFVFVVALFFFAPWTPSPIPRHTCADQGGVCYEGYDCEGLANQRGGEWSASSYWSGKNGGCPDNQICCFVLVDEVP
jgi:membrane-bound ClpP family serine protease